MKKKGKKRDPKDQFYTNVGISAHCIEVFQSVVDVAFDDILLVPQYSEILPRDVNISCQLTNNIKLKHVL